MRKFLFTWIHAWVQLADGLASVLTFGLWWPNWYFKMICWSETNRLNKLKYGRENERSEIWDSEEMDV